MYVCESARSLNNFGRRMPITATAILGESDHYSLQALRYTNLDVRILFEVGRGSASIAVSLSDDWNVNLTGVPTGVRITTQQFHGEYTRTVIEIPANEFNPTTPRFYLHVWAESNSTEYLL